MPKEDDPAVMQPDTVAESADRMRPDADPQPSYGAFNQLGSDREPTAAPLKSKKRRTKDSNSIGVIGFGASGKTVYLSMLYYLDNKYQMPQGWTADWTELDEGETQKHLNEISHAIRGVDPRSGEKLYVDKATQKHVKRFLPTGTVLGTRLRFMLYREWGLPNTYRSFKVDTMDVAGEALRQFAEGTLSENADNVRWHELWSLLEGSRAFLFFINGLKLDDIYDETLVANFMDKIFKMGARPKCIAFVIPGIDVFEKQDLVDQLKAKFVKRYAKALASIDRRKIPYEVFLVSSLGKGMTRKKSLDQISFEECKRPDHICPKCQELVTDAHVEPEPIGLGDPWEYIFRKTRPAHDATEFHAITLGVARTLLFSKWTAVAAVLALGTYFLGLPYLGGARNSSKLAELVDTRYAALSTPADVQEAVGTLAALKANRVYGMIGTAEVARLDGATRDLQEFAETEALWDPETPAAVQKAAADIYARNYPDSPLLALLPKAESTVSRLVADSRDASRAENERLRSLMQAIDVYNASGGADTQLRVDIATAASALAADLQKLLRETHNAVGREVAQRELARSDVVARQLDLYGELRELYRNHPSLSEWTSGINPQEVIDTHALLTRLDDYGKCVAIAQARPEEARSRFLTLALWAHQSPGSTDTLRALNRTLRQNALAWESMQPAPELPRPIADPTENVAVFLENIGKLQTIVRQNSDTELVARAQANLNSTRTALGSKLDTLVADLGTWRAGVLSGSEQPDLAQLKSRQEMQEATLADAISIINEPGIPGAMKAQADAVQRAVRDNQKLLDACLLNLQVRDRTLPAQSSAAERLAILQADTEQIYTLSTTYKGTQLAQALEATLAQVQERKATVEAELAFDRLPKRANAVNLPPSEIDQTLERYADFLGNPAYEAMMPRASAELVRFFDLYSQDPAGNDRWLASLERQINHKPRGAWSDALRDMASRFRDRNNTAYEQRTKADQLRGLLTSEYHDFNFGVRVLSTPFLAGQKGRMTVELSQITGQAKTVLQTTTLQVAGSTATGPSSFKKNVDTTRDLTVTVSLYDDRTGQYLLQDQVATVDSARLERSSPGQLLTFGLNGPYALSLQLSWTRN